MVKEGRELSPLQCGSFFFFFFVLRCKKNNPLKVFWHCLLQTNKSFGNIH